MPNVTHRHIKIVSRWLDNKPMLSPTVREAFDALLDHAFETATLHIDPEDTPMEAALKAVEEMPSSN